MKHLAKLEELVAGLTKKAEKAPSAAFEREVIARAKRYGELRQLVAEVLFLAKRHEAELTERRAEIARLHHRGLVARRRGDLEAARQLDRAKANIRAALREAEAERAEIGAQVAEAKETLHTAGSALAELAEEARGVARTERLDRLDRRMRQLSSAPEPDLDAARLELERRRAERTLERELLLLEPSR